MYAQPASRRMSLMVGLTILSTLAIVEPASCQEHLKELNRRVSGSVVTLEVLSGTGQVLGNGTGFFIDAERVVTNHHVIESASNVRATFVDNRQMAVTEVLAESPGSDLAILKVPGANARGIPLYRGSEVEVGEEVVVLGSPEGLAQTLSTGNVSAWRTNEQGVTKDTPLIQITAPISPGSSGSPVMNLRGEVLGVAVAVHRTGQNLNFAVPVSEVRRLLSAVRPEPVRAMSRRGSGFGWARNLLISLLVFGALATFLRRL